MPIRVPHTFSEPGWRWLPTGAKEAAAEAVGRFGQATSAVRPLPDYVMIGTQRGGTSSLHDYLNQHPRILTSLRKEVQFFSRHYARGTSWYRGNFPTRLTVELAARRSGGEPVVGEASPYYLFHPAAADRMSQVLPDARIVVMLRNPVSRAFSHYQHNRSLGLEPLTFPEALAREDERTAGEAERVAADPSGTSWALQHFSYAARGMYREQLDRWFAVYRREQFLLLRSEDFFADPQAVYDRTLEFLGVEPRPLRTTRPVNSRSYERLDPETREQLAERFREPNRRLAELLGPEFSWE